MREAEKIAAKMSGVDDDECDIFKFSGSSLPKAGITNQLGSCRVPLPAIRRKSSSGETVGNIGDSTSSGSDLDYEVERKSGRKRKRR